MYADKGEWEVSNLYSSDSKFSVQFRRYIICTVQTVHYLYSLDSTLSVQFRQYIICTV